MAPTVALHRATLRVVEDPEQAELHGIWQGSPSDFFCWLCYHVAVVDFLPTNSVAQLSMEFYLKEAVSKMTPIQLIILNSIQCNSIQCNSIRLKQIRKIKVIPRIKAIHKPAMASKLTHHNRILLIQPTK